MLSKKDIEELATGAVKRYFNTCNLVSPQIQENDKTPDWDGELNLYENKKDIRKNYIGSLRIQVKGKEVPKFKDKKHSLSKRSSLKTLGTKDLFSL